jgi:hypothetical protein
VKGLSYCKLHITLYDFEKYFVSELYCETCILNGISNIVNHEQTTKNKQKYIIAIIIYLLFNGVSIVKILTKAYC